MTGIIAGDDLVDVVEEGQAVSLVLAETPFYATKGGQLADHGVITTPTGRFRVTDTTSPADGLIWHHGIVESGTFRVKDDVHAAIDALRRTNIMKGHSGTHILHATVKEVLGEHAHQAGSSIDSDRFRFDFPHFSAVEAEQLDMIQRIVNERIFANELVTTEIMDTDAAIKAGAVAHFGEKYADKVRVVKMGGYSLELCGGTHVANTSEVGLFTIISEGSVGNNLRRIEALTGTTALDHLKKEALVADLLAKHLKVPVDQAADRLIATLQRLAALEKQIANLRQADVLAQVDNLVAQATLVTLPSGTTAKVVHTVVDDADHDTMRSLANAVVAKLGVGIAVVGTKSADGKAMLLAAVSPELVEQGIHAAEVLRPGAQVVGGGAGGRGPVAQAGGKDGEKLGEAIHVAAHEAQTRLNNLGA